MPTVGLYIEDADSNGNWYPDAWEYQYINHGTNSWDDIKRKLAASVLPEGEIVLSKEMLNNMTSGLANISTGLTGAKITVFQDALYAELLLDPYGDWDSTNTTFDVIRKAVNSNIVERTRQ